MLEQVVIEQFVEGLPVEVSEADLWAAIILAEDHFAVHPMVLATEEPTPGSS